MQASTTESPIDKEVVAGINGFLAEQHFVRNDRTRNIGNPNLGIQVTWSLINGKVQLTITTIKKVHLEGAIVRVCDQVSGALLCSIDLRRSETNPLEHWSTIYPRSFGDITLSLVIP